MIEILTKLFGGGAKNIAGSLTGIADKFIRTKEEKAEFEKQMTEIFINAEAEQQKNVTEVFHIYLFGIKEFRESGMQK